MMYKSYRSKVGPGDLWDVIGAQQFCAMISLGLREHHSLLDFGCGSLRGGRLFIPYLDAGNYFGVEPDFALVYEGIYKELGQDLALKKQATFYHFDDFLISKHIDRKFNYVLAQSILSHAGIGIVETVIKEVSIVLERGGTFAFTFFEGKDSGNVGWLGDGVATHSIDTIRSIGYEYNFRLRELKNISHPMNQWWVALTSNR